MPDALAALYAGAQAVGAWLGSTAVASLTWAQVITTTFAVYGTVNAREGARRSRNQARDAYNAGLTDRTVTFTDPNAPWQICYGEPTVGGRVVAMLTSGDRDQYKHLVVVWVDHECDAITETYLAGVALGTLDSNGDVTSGKWLKTLTGTTTTTVTLDGAGYVDLGRPGASLLTLSFEQYVGDYITNDVLVAGDWTVAGNTITLTAGHVAAWAGRTVQANFSDNATQPMVRVRHYLGGAGPVADAQLITDCPGDWSSTDVLTGKCYSIFRFNLDEPEFQSGPPALKVRLRGKKLYDHRTLATTWSANPALCVADFLMGEYGKQQPSNAIDWATVDAAANVCDEALASHGGAARYRCDGAVLTDADTDQTLDALCQSMAGFATDAGAWRLQAGAYTAPVMALTVADNAGSIELLAGAAGLEVFNGLRGKYFDPDRFDQLTDYTPYQNTAFVSADGGVAMWGSLNMPFTAADWRATNLARIQVERSRGQQLVFPAKLRAVRLKVGQRVTLTVPWLNLDAAVFRLVKKEFKPGGAVMLSMEQDDASYYDEADAPAPLASPTAAAQDPWVVAPVAGLAAVSSDAIAQRDSDGTVLSRVRVSWTAVTDTLVISNGAVQVEYRPAESTEWARVPEINALATRCDLQGPQNNRLYFIRARLRNGLGAVSDWRTTFVVTNVLALGEAALVNFNGRNDRIATAVPAPTIATDGSAVDHTINVNASADVSFEWAWAGSEPDIDGFQVLVRVSATGGAYTVGASPAQETVLAMPANKRAFVALGLDPTQHITFAVRAYRVVDPDIDAAGLLFSAWVKPSLTAEDPYQPASSVAFAGDVTGTVAGIPAANVNVWSAVTGAGKPASYATVGKSLGLPFESWNLNGQTIVALGDGKVGSAALRLSAGGYPNQGNYTAIDRTKKYRVRFWARPSATTVGILYFSLQQFTDNAGTTGPVNGGRSPYKPSGQSRDAHNTQFGGTDQWGEYSYIWEAADWQAGVQFVRPDFLDNYSLAAGYWEVQDFSFEEVTEVVDAKTAADAAIAAAGDAQTDADTANAAIANIVSDNVLAKGEKGAVILDWTAIDNEYSFITDQAIAYGVGSELTNYIAAKGALGAYLTSLTPPWNDATQDTPITGTTFRTKFSDVYLYRQAVLDAIAGIAKTLADNAQTDATAAGVFAGLAASAAADAQADADTANAAIGNISSDNVLSKGEKGQVILDWAAISGDQSGIDAQATAYTITTEKTAYDNAVAALSSYLSGLSPAWNDTGTDTAITGSTFRTKFADVYTTRQALLNKFAEVAGTRATWASVSGTGKPADNATVGAQFGVNITGQAATTDIADNAVTYTVTYADTGGVYICPSC